MTWLIVTMIAIGALIAYVMLNTRDPKEPLVYRAFVSASWAWADKVRDVHLRLRSMGVIPTSEWAYDANGDAEGLEYRSGNELRKAWLANREGVRDAHYVIVLADSPGRETFAEAEYARIYGKTILWVGKDSLSSIAADGKFRRYTNIDDALAELRYEIG